MNQIKLPEWLFKKKSKLKENNGKSKNIIDVLVKYLVLDKV